MNSKWLQINPVTLQEFKHMPTYQFDLLLRQLK